MIKPKSEFSTNVLLMMAGTSIAQAIPIAISPILSRMFSPHDFGVLALYIAISSMIAVFATARYELAIVIPQEDADALNILTLTILSTSIIALSSLILIILFHDIIINSLNNQEISLWLYFIPVTVFFTGLYNSFNYWFTRKKEFKKVAESRINQAITTAVSNLGIGYFKHGPSGLVLGGILGSAATTGILWINFLKNEKNNFSQISWERIIQQAKLYIRFPKYSVAGGVLNISAYQIPIILISSFFPAYLLGIFYFVNRILQAPFMLLSHSFSQVFYEQAARQDSPESLRQLLSSTHKKLILIYIIPSVILLAFGEELFAFVFGEEWRIAGYYAKILLPFLIISFLFSTTSTVMFLYNKNKFEIILNGMLALALSLAIILGIMTHSFDNAVILYSIFGTLIFLYFGYWTYSEAKFFKNA